MHGLPSYIHFTAHPEEKLNEIIQHLDPDKTVFLVDENTRRHCLNIVASKDINVIEIESGESQKHLNTCNDIWQQMTEFGMSRQSLLINLGGGVIGDMGGFVASTYKRGIRFVNIPTTLLSQVDASIGGKLGIDFQGLKNHIGLFRDPEAVILADVFLQSLDPRQLRSGYAEVIKHGLIWDQEYFQAIQNHSFPKQTDWPYLLKRSVEIKSEVVNEDPLEKGLRKILNFGHTLGHAVETYHLESKMDILHGEAIAIGMIMELHLSQQLGWMEEKKVTELSQWLLKIFDHLDTIPDTKVLMDLMAHDKKNTSRQINFSLLERIGKCRFDVQVKAEQIDRAIDHYRQFR
jgi:3-dehydroquinate synthase